VLDEFYEGEGGVGFFGRWIYFIWIASYLVMTRFGSFYFHKDIMRR